MLSCNSATTSDLYKQTLSIIHRRALPNFVKLWHFYEDRTKCRISEEVVMAAIIKIEYVLASSTTVMGANSLCSQVIPDPFYNHYSFH